MLDGALPARGFDSPVRRGARINERELVTVRMALESFRPFLTERDTRLLIKSDSTVSVGLSNSKSGRGCQDSTCSIVIYSAWLTDVCHGAGSNRDPTFTISDCGSVFHYQYSTRHTLRCSWRLLWSRVL